MCPDRQLLSVYLDQELPSPWKEKMEAHLRECPECQARFSQYQRVSAAIAAPFAKGPSEEMANRVWEGVLEGNRKGSRFSPSQSLWRRTISIPIPAAAAAAAAAIAIIIYSFFFNSPPADRQMESVLAGISQELQDIVPAASLEEVLQYLGRDQSNDIVIIQLPESESFTSYGKPMIIKAADYSWDK